VLCMRADISAVRRKCAVPSVAVCCSSLISYFTSICCSDIFLNDFEIVSFAPVITGITFVFTCHVLCISVAGSLHFRIFSASS